MNRSRVYLAGPITGHSYGSCSSWRDYAIERLASHSILGVSPLRGKEYLASLPDTLSAHGREYAHLNVISSPKAVLARDRFDATRCDVLLVNVVGAHAPSLGTVMEIAFADAHRIPIIVAGNVEGGPHDHMMIREATGFDVVSLDEALDVAIAILHHA